MLPYIISCHHIIVSWNLCLILFVGLPLFHSFFPWYFVSTRDLLPQGDLRWHWGWQNLCRKHVAGKLWMPRNRCDQPPWLWRNDMGWHAQQSENGQGPGTKLRKDTRPSWPLGHLWTNLARVFEFLKKVSDGLGVSVELVQLLLICLFALSQGCDQQLEVFNLR